MKKIVIIGSTGSIGTQTLEVCNSNKEKLQVYGLTAGKNLEKLKSQIIEYHPKYYDNLDNIEEELDEIASSITMAKLGGKKQKKRKNRTYRKLKKNTSCD